MKPNFLNLLFAAAILTGTEAFAKKLMIPSQISCKHGSVFIKQVGPTESFNNINAAAFTLTANGATESATGIESGNFTKVSGYRHYVFAGTGGLTFGKRSDKKNVVICTNSKYGTTSPEFSYQ